MNTSMVCIVCSVCKTEIETAPRCCGLHHMVHTCNKSTCISTVRTERDKCNTNGQSIHSFNKLLGNRQYRNARKRAA